MVFFALKGQVVKTSGSVFKWLKNEAATILKKPKINNVYVFTLTKVVIGKSLRS